MHDDFDDDDWISKTDLKKDAEAAQKVGEQLLTVTDDFLQSLDLDEELVDAIALAKRIKHHSGKRRQIQRVGKLMRQEDLTQIKQALATLHQASRASRNQFHLAERIRDALIANGVKDIDRLLPTLASAEYKTLHQELKQLQNCKNGTPAYKKHARNVFRLVSDNLPPL